MKTTFLLLLCLTFLLSSCGNNNEEGVLTIEQIQAIEGIPVEIERVGEQHFEMKYSYLSSLHSTEEVVTVSKNSDRVGKINFSVGDRIRKGEVVVEFPEDNPTLQYEQITIAYENSKQTWLRMKSLYEKGGISKQEFDQIEANYLVNKANRDNIRKILFVEAPINGYLTQLDFLQSENVSVGDPLFTISGIEKYKTRVWATENEILDIEVGQRTFARWKDVVLEGQVVQIALNKNISRQAYPVDIELENPDGYFLGGITATVEIVFYENEAAVLVPRHYVTTDYEGNHYCFVARGNRAQKTSIKVGRSSSLNFEIIEGLNVGDNLITKGSSLVSDNSLIKIVQ